MHPLDEDFFVEDEPLEVVRRNWRRGEPALTEGHRRPDSEALLATYLAALEFTAPDMDEIEWLAPSGHFMERRAFKATAERLFGQLTYRQHLEFFPDASDVDRCQVLLLLSHDTVGEMIRLLNEVGGSANILVHDEKHGRSAGFPMFDLAGTKAENERIVPLSTPMSTFVYDLEADQGAGRNVSLLFEQAGVQFHAGTLGFPAAA